MQKDEWSKAHCGLYLVQQTTCDACEATLTTHDLYSWMQCIEQNDDIEDQYVGLTMVQTCMLQNVR